MDTQLREWRWVSAPLGEPPFGVEPLAIGSQFLTVVLSPFLILKCVLPC